MKFSRIFLENFFSYGEEQSLDLSKPGLFLITGQNDEQTESQSNGAGKCVRKGTKIITKEFGEVNIETLFPDAEYGEVIVIEEPLHVYTDEGWNLIELFWVTEPQNLIEIELEDGKKLCASIDHRVMTKRGWVKLKDLTDSDSIVVNE